MIIELFGLPASGKTTLARALEAEGVARVKAPHGVNLIWNALPFFFWHPVRTGTQLWYLFRYAPRGSWYTLFIHAVLAHAATWQQAARLSHKGKVALIDQGHHQNLLSVFGRPPGDTVLERYQASFPRPDLLLIVETDTQVRTERLSDRPNSDAETVLRRDVAEQATYQQSLTLFARKSLPYQKIQGDTTRTLSEILTKNISYVTVARMPTEKAHGISIAHMCAALSGEGSSVELIVPHRKNTLSENIYTYYGVPEIFKTRYVSTPDFLGQGLAHPIFFFLQRLLFVRTLLREGIPPGTLYTREPEIAFAFARTHQVVFEVHRWPTGMAGWVTAHLIRLATLVVCNSLGTEKALQGAGIRRTLVVPNGFSEKDFANVESKENARVRLGLDTNATIALYVGLLSSGKGVATFFEAAEKLLPAIQSVAIGGTPEEVSRLSKLYPSVQFLGFKPYRDLADNLAAADVLVLPNTAKDTESARYTSPIKLFGYMASGAPIVASDLPSVREMLSERNACLVRPDDPLALAEGIKDICEHRDHAQTLARKAKEDVREYTWPRRAQRVLAALTTPL